jgi:hypothetical protein
MTALKMLELFRQKYNSSSFTNDTMGDDEIYLFLNDAYDRFIKQRFTGNNARGVAFDGDQKRIDDLKALLFTSSAISPAVSASNSEIPNSVNYDLPADYMYHVATYVEDNRTDIENTDKYVGCEVIANEFVSRYSTSGHNNPVIRKPLVVFRKPAVFTIIHQPSTTLGDVIMTYLKEFDEISGSQDCELSKHTHREIVSIAVGLALEVTESKRFQTNTEKLSKIE